MKKIIGTVVLVSLASYSHAEIGDVRLKGRLGDDDPESCHFN